MTVDPAVVTGATLQSGQSQAAQSTAPLSVPETIVGDKATGDQISLSGKPEAGYQHIQSKHEQGNADASAIRHTDSSLQAVGQKVGALKAPLEAIVKNFPPFSAEDKARVKLLKQYSSLRKEIDELTLPPPPEVVQARKMAALPAPLPTGATDSQIADHISKLDATVASLNETRAAMASDTAALLQGNGFSRLYSGAGSADTGFAEAPLTPGGAEQKSLEVGQQFANGIAQGVTGRASQFLKRMS